MAEGARVLTVGGPNLQRLKPTRQKPQAGDVFAMGLPDGQYLFGRVILADLPIERAPMPAYMMSNVAFPPKAALLRRTT